MSKQQEILKVEIKCLKCKQTHIIEVPKKGYMRWLDTGARIQDVMPELPANDRELLISNICGPCFDKIFE